MHTPPRLALIVLLLLDAGCNSSRAIEQDAAPHTQKDASAEPPDTGPDVSPGDTSAKADEAVRPCNNYGMLFKATSNSAVRCGQTCKSDVDCKAFGSACVDLKHGLACTTTSTYCGCGCASKDERCFRLNDATGQEVGMCMGRCCWRGTNILDDPAAACPVPDPVTQKAACAVLNMDDGNMNCAILCSFNPASGGGVKTYPCPPGMDCVVWMGLIKFCAPSPLR